MQHLIADNNVNDTNLVDLLRHRVERQANQPAYTFVSGRGGEDQRLTYAQLDRQARAIAVQLSSVCSNGDRVLLLYPPGLAFIAGLFGCLYAGLTAVPVIPPLSARSSSGLFRLQAIAKESQAQLVLTTHSIQSNAKPLLREMPELSSLRWLPINRPEVGLADQWRRPHLSGDALALLQYTSGSTACPKGVMVSHANLLHNSAAICQSFQHSPDSRGVIWLPPYHDMGLIGGVLQPLYVGFPVTLMSPMDFLLHPIHWLRTISAAKATTSGGPNFAYELCVQKTSPVQRETLDLSSWDVAFIGAEPIRRDTLDRFVNAFEPYGFRREAFYPCYGLAESTLFVSGVSKSQPPVAGCFEAAALENNRVVDVSADRPEARHIVGCGRSALDQQIVIVDPETRTPCPRDTVGEIWISGPSVAHGYWNREEDTSETFRAYLAGSGEGPFLRTGDLGFLRGGELFVTGRLKDLIIFGGRNHYSEDVERTVERCHPLIRRGCCAAFSVDLAGKEQLVTLAEVERRFCQRVRRESHTVMQDGRQHTGGDRSTGQSQPESNGRARFDPTTVVQAIREAVVQHHDLRVHDVLLLKPAGIPKTSSGKIQRHVCRKRYLMGTLKVVGTS